jgi:carbamate kinase
VLADGQGSTIADQRRNARVLADNLLPILESDSHVAVLHGNKPQVGFVLLRSELASHMLHTVPLDVCGADTQGATGYMLSQAFTNVLQQGNAHRRVMCVVTQTLIDNRNVPGVPQTRAIGPWFDRDKAEYYRHSRSWTIAEEPGYGYRRAVPSLPPVAIMEIEGIKQLVASGDIVIAGGGGGIPVVRNSQGGLDGIEAVVETEAVACLMARELGAEILLMVIEGDKKFLLSGLTTESANHLSLDELDKVLSREIFRSRSVYSKLAAASEFLHGGGSQVVITTLRRLPATFKKQNGLRIGALAPPVELAQLARRSEAGE